MIQNFILFTSTLPIAEMKIKELANKQFELNKN